MTFDLRRHGVRAVLLDIEGTTTPITFVYDVLFPYARERMHEYVRAHLDDADVVVAEGMLRDDWRDDAARGEPVPPWPLDAELHERDVTIARYALWLMDRDRKSPGLKLLQGKIWQGGYESGHLRGEVFPDVPPAFERWTAAGHRLAIYSSGSVLAQRLIFGHTVAGDLTPYVSAYFDTGVGAKVSADSYRRIASELGMPERDVLFVSDVARELEAAAQAGVQVVMAQRPGNPPQDAEKSYDRVVSFDAII